MCKTLERTRVYKCCLHVGHTEGRSHAWVYLYSGYAVCNKLVHTQGYTLTVTQRGDTYRHDSSNVGRRREC